MQDTENTQETPAVETAAADQFITVPEVTLPNGVVVPSFKVGKYISSKGADGQVQVTVDGTPWVEINYHASREAAQSAGFKLLTETQALAIAHDIAQQDINWTSGTVGIGEIFMGLHRGIVDNAQPASYTSPHGWERRWHELSNGERIYDFAGNCYSWVFDDVQGDENGIVARAFTEDSPSLSIANGVAPSMEKGTGWRPSPGRDWSGNALFRGGCWCSADNAGVFGLSHDWPDSERDDVGFRCTK